MCIAGLNTTFRQHLGCHLNTQETINLAENHKIGGIKELTLKGAIVKIRQEWGDKEFRHFEGRVNRTIKSGKKEEPKQTQLLAIQKVIQEYTKEIRDEKIRVKQNKADEKAQKAENKRVKRQGNSMSGSAGEPVYGNIGPTGDPICGPTADPIYENISVLTGQPLGGAGAIIDGFSVPPNKYEGLIDEAAFICTGNQNGSLFNKNLEKKYAEKENAFKDAWKADMDFRKREAKDPKNKALFLQEEESNQQFTDFSIIKDTLIKNSLSTSDSAAYKQAVERLPANLIYSPEGEVMGIATQYPMERDKVTGKATGISDYFRSLKESQALSATVLVSNDDIAQPSYNMYKYFKEDASGKAINYGNGIVAKSTCVKKMTFGALKVEQYELKIQDTTDGSMFTLPILHCTNWKDHCGSNPIDLIEMTKYKMLLDAKRATELDTTYGKVTGEEKRKAWVHCRAGVGRTGTLMGIEIMLKNLRKWSAFSIMTAMRVSRTSLMVQSDVQARTFAGAAMLVGNKVFDKDGGFMTQRNLIELRTIPKEELLFDSQNKGVKEKPALKPKPGLKFTS